MSGEHYAIAFLAVLLVSPALAAERGGLGGALGRAGDAAGGAGRAAGSAVGGLGGAVGGALGGRAGGAVSGAAGAVGGAIGGVGSAAGGAVSGTGAAVGGSLGGGSTSTGAPANSSAPAGSGGAPGSQGAVQGGNWAGAPRMTAAIAPIQLPTVPIPMAKPRKRNKAAVPSRLLAWLDAGGIGGQPFLARQDNEAIPQEGPSESELRLGLIMATPEETVQIKHVCTKIVSQPAQYGATRFRSCTMVLSLLAKGPPW